mgnify:FL=1
MPNDTFIKNMEKELKSTAIIEAMEDEIYERKCLAGLITESTSYQMDAVSRFIDDECHMDLTQNVSVSSLYEHYVSWCKSQDIHPRTKIQFGKYLTSKGYVQVRDSVGRYWQGLATNLPTGKKDMVNSPSHYNKHGIECIQAIRATLTDEEFRGYCKGNVLKYTWREAYKNKDEDLQKARWYLNRLLSELGSGP